MEREEGEGGEGTARRQASYVPKNFNILVVERESKLFKTFHLVLWCCVRHTLVLFICSTPHASGFITRSSSCNYDGINDQCTWREAAVRCQECGITSLRQRVPSLQLFHCPRGGHLLIVVLEHFHFLFKLDFRQ